jgi:hypothetical protein
MPKFIIFGELFANMVCVVFVETRVLKRYGGLVVPWGGIRPEVLINAPVTICILNRISTASERPQSGVVFTEPVCLGSMFGGTVHFHLLHRNNSDSRTVGNRRRRVNPLPPIPATTTHPHPDLNLGHLHNSHRPP